MPLTIAEFSRLVSESSVKAIQHLKEVWIPTCAKLISNKREEVEAWMPENEVCFLPRPTKTPAGLLFPEAIYF